MLTTLERVKDLLRIPQEDTTRDLLLEAAARAASDLIESYCRRSFELKAYTDRVDGSGTPYLVLKNYPIKAVSALKYRDAAEDINSIEVLTDKGLLFRRSGWVRGDLLYTVTYEAGYVLRTDAEAGTLPEALEFAVALFAQQMLKQQQQAGIESKRVGDISVTYQNEFNSKNGTPQLPSFVRSLIDPYRGRWL